MPDTSTALQMWINAYCDYLKYIGDVVDLYRSLTNDSKISYYK